MNNFIAYDCMLFLSDPSIRPDNLLNISKHLNGQSEINNKSTIDDFITFFQSKIENVNKDIKKFESNSIIFQIYKDVDFTMLKILSEMENEGISVSKEKMKKLSKSLSVKIKKLQNKCFEITNKEFNLNLDIPYFKKTIPTTENLAIYIWKKLNKAIELNCKITVILYETPRNFVEYSE